MDYGNRQKRAEFLLRALRKRPDDEVVYATSKGEYTAKQLAFEVENQTKLGSSVVALTGLVIRALLEEKHGQER